MTTSTLTSWALLIWNTLKEEGHNPLAAFNAAGADLAKLGDGQARYDIRQMCALWENAVQVTGNADFGVDAGKRWGPTTFHALGFAWLASNSLLDGLRRLSRYAKLVNNSLVVTLESAGNNFFLTINTSARLELRHPAATDAGIAALLTMCRYLAGGSFRPVELKLVRDYRAPGKLEALAGCSTLYKQDDNALVFDALTATKELATANVALARSNEHIAAEYLQRIAMEDIPVAVRSNITKLLPTGDISEEKIAARLNMNLRTLQRRLKEEGSNFRDLLNSTREDIAQDYIRNSRLSLTEIAYLLGFADQANFTRAFRRWTGVSPSEFRKALNSKKIASL